MNYIESFESHLREQGKAEKTIQSYSGDTIKFLTYLESKELSFDGNLNRFSIISYKNHLIKGNYEPTTINKKLNSIQSFNDYLIHEGIMTEKIVELGRDRIKIAKGSEKPVEVYSEDLIETLLFHMENVKHLRDKVIVQLLLFTGVRVSVLCGIRIRDIDFLSHQLKVIGKREIYREIPLKVEIVESIKKYLLDGEITNTFNQTIFFWDKDDIVHLPKIGMTKDTMTVLESIPEYIEVVTLEAHLWYRCVIIFGADAGVVIYVPEELKQGELANWIDTYKEETNG